MTRQTVYNLLTDAEVPHAWKLQELHKLLHRAEKSRDENKCAVETLEAHIRDHPESDEVAQWQQMLEANRHDFDLHIARLT